MKIEYEAGSRSAVSFTMTAPDDMHLHVRDGAALESVIGYSARQFRRAIIMPNLKPPVTTVEMAVEYERRIRRALPTTAPSSTFRPLMTIYLTDRTEPAEIMDGHLSRAIHAVKYYPAGATTNSEDGVTDLEKVHSVLEIMAKVGMPLLLHAEATDPTVDVFNREKVFLHEVFMPLRRRYPTLRIVLEHITTADAADIILNVEAKNGSPTAATITAHHLLNSRNSLFAGGMRPHNFCYPIMKSEGHREVLLKAATSGNPRFFLGTDSAPHAQDKKECDCAAGGCYTAPHALELYAEAFDSVGKLDRLEGFASHFGADFYGLPRNTNTVTLVRKDSLIETSLPFGEGRKVVPFRAGERLQWEFQE